MEIAEMRDEKEEDPNRPPEAPLPQLSRMRKAAFVALVCVLPTFVLGSAMGGVGGGIFLGVCFLIIGIVIVNLPDVEPLSNSPILGSVRRQGYKKRPPRS